MHIIWKGQSCFQILASPAVGQTVSILLDPFSKESGLKIPKVKADILLASHPDYKGGKNNLPDSPFLITEPGEYEVKKVFIQGIPAKSKQGKITIYTIEVEGIRISHLSELSQADLTPTQLEKLGNIDILMVPVGDVYTLSATQAAEIINQIQPHIAIPMCYSIPNLKLKLNKLDTFLEIMGQREIVPQPKLLVKKKDIPENFKIVVLKT